MDVAVLLILAADFGFTTLHSWQEWKGAGGPLWRNFGAIVGLEIPDAIGFPLFTVGLTLMLFAVGFIAIIGPLGHTWTAFALGALIGARLSDTLVSHVRLYVKGYRPNPGLSSTRFTFSKPVSSPGCFTPVFQQTPPSQPLASSSERLRL